MIEVADAEQLTSFFPAVCALVPEQPQQTGEIYGRFSNFTAFWIPCAAVTSEIRFAASTAFPLGRLSTTKPFSSLLRFLSTEADSSMVLMSPTAPAAS